MVVSQNINIRISENNTPIKIALLDKKGKTLLESINVTINQGNYLYNMRSALNHIPEGIYFLQLAIGDELTIQKVVFLR